jgi:hypothetical protein
LLGVDLARARAVVEETVSYLESELGSKAWHVGMNPEVPARQKRENPYTYTK